MEEVENRFSGKVKDATKLSNKLEQTSTLVLDEISKLIQESIVKKKDVLASSVGETVIEGGFKNMLRANLYVMKANNVYAEVKENLLLRVKGKVIEAHSDTRALRESLKADFMGDPTVLSEIKTIKHQELAFDGIFKDFLADYTKVKNNLSRLETVEQFLNSGISNLNSLIKFTYNIDYLNRELPFDTEENLPEDKDVKITFDEEEKPTKKKSRKNAKKKKSV